MSDYKALVADLRDAGQVNWKRLSLDAAAAIEDLQARVSKLEERTKAQQERLEDYMEKQLIIDRWGAKWMTSAKDVPTAAYEHGYADGRDEAEAQLPKRGEWIHVESDEPWEWRCTACHKIAEGLGEFRFCPNCGAKMEVQDGENES